MCMRHTGGMASAADAHNEIHGSVDGHVVQARDIYVISDKSVARSAYLHLVRGKIAPRELKGREDELAELASFCTDRHRPSYVWWRAGAWAGKSALLSWFVLHPPPGVRIVSFFVTGRIPRQSDREAFTKVVMEQLSELLGRPMRTEIVHWDAELWQTFADAARECARRDERLILLVDGLDEDRGVTVEPDSYSIAGLLPPAPTDGMRVIVAGRPSPPIPGDVGSGHPLLDEAIVRPLTASPYAEAVKEDSNRELKHLLRGSQVERDLLGLLAASGGGLSGADLVELTGSPEGNIEDHLHAVTARSFAPRTRSVPEGGPDVYMFGHEQLLTAASRFIGRTGLAVYRARLHGWADGYRDQGWPADTPAYLLRDYHAMVRATADVDRLVAYALDTTRQNRLRAITGGDGAAISELTTAQEALFTAEKPDLNTMARIAVHRGVLIQRNEAVTVNVAPVWAELGEIERAVSIAFSRNSRAIEAETLASIATAIATSGDIGVARGLVRRASSLLERLPDPWLRQLVDLSVVCALAALGDVDTAEAIIRTIRVAQQRSLADAVRRLLDAGDAVGAYRLASAIVDPAARVHALVPVFEVAILADDRGRVDVVAEQIETIIDSIGDRAARAIALVDLVRVARLRGDHERAVMLVREIETCAESDSAGVLVDVLIALVEAVALCGDLDRAETLARNATNPSARALVALASSAADAGEMDRAQRIARSISDSFHQGEALAAVSSAAATVGDVDQAETIGRSIPDRTWRARALAAVARSACAVGDATRAREILVEVETIPQGVYAHAALDDMTTLATALAAAGYRDRAHALMQRAITVARNGVGRNTWSLLAKAATAAGDFDTATTAARSIEPDLLRDIELAAVATAEAEAGALDRAVLLCRSISGPTIMARTLTLIAQRAATCGDLVGADAVARSVDPASISGCEAVRAVALAAARAGDVDRAESLAFRVRPYELPALLVALVEAALDTGQVAVAMTIVDRAESQARQLSERHEQGGALQVATQVAAAAGQLNRAERLARLVPNGWERADALATVAVAAVSTGRMSQAHSLFVAIQELANARDGYFQDLVLVPAVRAALALGEFGWAERASQSISAEHIRLKALRAFVDAAIDAGDLGRAEAVACTLTGCHRIDAARDIIRAAIELEDFERAEKLIGSLLFEPNRTSAVVDLTNALAAAGRLAAAERLALGLTDVLREAAIATVMAAAAAAGDLDRAVALAHTARTALSRIESLVRVVRIARAAGHADKEGCLVEEIEHLARGEDGQYSFSDALAAFAAVAPPSVARNVIAEVLTLRRWTQVLKVLAPLGFGDLLAQIADEYLIMTNGPEPAGAN
jgi:hypothetical protein